MLYYTLLWIINEDFLSHEIDTKKYSVQYIVCIFSNFSHLSYYTVDYNMYEVTFYLG